MNLWYDRDMDREQTIRNEVRSMQLTTIPGTVMAYDPRMGGELFAAVSSLWQAAGGLSLSQITALTGLEATTIQNWVKRGWVSRTVGKKYNERQIARILLINVLRDCLPLEKIAGLLAGVNGAVEDESDDIIDEGELYNRLCLLLAEMEELRSGTAVIREAVNRQLTDYRGPQPDSKARLACALEIMVLAYQASRLKQLADQRLTEWLGG